MHLQKTPSNIALIVLAAGASKRMETPKQLLKWGDSNLISHTIQTALKSSVNNVIVVLGANFKLIEEQINHFPITILNNKNWHLGLGKSLAFGIEYLLNLNKKTEACLVALADQPLINTRFLNDLIDEYNKKQHSIIATSYKNNKQGVPVIFDNRYFEELVTLNDDKGAKHILEKYKLSVKTLNPEIDNVDLDFKAEYDVLYKRNFDD